MSLSRKPAILLSALLALAPLGLAGAADAPKTEIKGAAILDHPCGKVAVKQMGLIHAGKFEEANKLTSPEMRGRGMGARALVLAEEHCHRNGIEALRLEVHHENHRALALYERNGFEAHDRYLMTKWLQALPLR